MNGDIYKEILGIKSFSKEVNKLKRCITTLPITPRINPGINLMIQPFVMDVFGIKMGLDRVLSLSSCGLKSENKDSSLVSHSYVESNKELGILPNFVWRNDFEQTLSLTKTLVQELIDLGHVFQEETEIIKCGCGVVESLATACNISSARKKYNNDSCLVCKERIFRTKELVYLFRFPNYMSGIPIQTFPKFYEKEIRNMASRFSGYKFLISKSRMSALSLEVHGSKISLDIDFAWQLFLSSLYRIGYDVQFLVGANRNLMACLFTAALFNILDKKKIVIIVPPLCLAPGRQKLSRDQYGMSSLLTKYGTKTIRILLSTAINWKRKESVIDFELLDILERVSGKIRSLPKNDSDIIKIASIFNKQSIKKVLAFARKKEVFKFEELFGVI